MRRRPWNLLNLDAPAGVPPFELGDELPDDLPLSAERPEADRLAAVSPARPR